MDFLINYVFSRRILVGGNRKSARKRGGLNSFCTFAYKNTTMLNLDDFYRARYVLSNVVRRTDLIYAPKINQESEIYLKPENLQVTGSFKLRGSLL